MPKNNLLPFSRQESVTKLQQSGYITVFDVINKSCADFIKSVSDMEPTHARQVYRQARERAETLKSLFRAWQLRQEPVISRLQKLMLSPPQHINETLLRNLGGDGDFSDLMMRSTDYADAASIQSLFSPGRYAVSLYKVARSLHESNSAFNIDNRRPDMKKLILSETTMSQEISSLDLLLEVLQGNDRDRIDALSDCFFPMTLPYDDKLMRINAAVGAQGRTLLGIWDILSDVQASSFVTNAQSMRSVSLTEEIAGRPFYLQADGKMVFLAHATSGGHNLPGAHLNVGRPDAQAKLVAPLYLIRKDDLIYLGVHGDITINGISLTGCYLMADNGQDNGKEGEYARMGSVDKDSVIHPDRYLYITLEPNGENGVWIKTNKGYIGCRSSGASDWPEAMTVTEPTTATALSFICSNDNAGEDIISFEMLLPPKTSPKPPARTLLNLTPVSYQLMANTDLTEENIRDHYGISVTSSRADTAIAEILNTMSIFCEKTGLVFNQVLELTAQRTYKQSGGKPGQSRHPMSRFNKFGMVYTPEVHKYGAAFINSEMDASISDILLWVQPEKRDAAGSITTPATLNFKNDTVVSLAGNAEKIIRLHNTTGLSFEMLDWVIAQASNAAGYTHPTLDSVTLDALASCVDFKQRYGISENVFVSFIGAVNPYALAQEKSFFEILFTYPDETGCIPMGTTIKYSRSEGLYETTCYKALGVTSDEFARIGHYCFGNSGSFKMSEDTAGQIYRFSAIPRMLGLTFAEAECLWQLMAGGTNALLTTLGRNTGLAAIDLIRRSEQVLSWMADNSLNLLQVQAMVSSVYSGTATAEMFTFLQNVYHSVKDTSVSTRDMNAALQQKVWRALAGGFGIKVNIMCQVTKWLDKTDLAFTLDKYWERIADFFKNEQNTSVDSLQQNKNGLVEATQRLSQLVLVARWLNLSEQDLMLLTEAPQQLDSTLTATPQPHLYLLLLLSRLKLWQDQVTTSVDEALRLLPILANDASEPGDVADKIAAIHNLTSDSVAAMSTFLFGKGNHPGNFAQLYTLLTWLRTGQNLNVGTATLHDLRAMSQSNLDAESALLLARVADALTAGLTR